MKRRASRAATTILVVADPTSRLRVLVEPSSFHACPTNVFAPLPTKTFPERLMVQISIVRLSYLAVIRLANSCLIRLVRRTRRSGARRKLELIMHLPTSTFMTSALQVMLPFVMSSL